MNKLLILLAIALCGTSAYVLDTGVEDRIANGNVAADNQFLYTVSLQRLALLGTPTRGHICGGVLFTLRHALTAATCVYEIINGVMVPITPNQHRVFAGSALLTNDNSPDRFRSINSITIPPGHIPRPAHINDIAILTLQTPFLNITVRALPLPNPNFAPADNTHCVTAGWGAQSADTNVVNASVGLRFAEKYIYNQALCQSVYAGLFGVSNVFPSMVCAASFNIISTGCPGDVGSALVCDNQLTGILFHTNDCQASSFPELYTRISNHTAWIRSVTGGASSFKPALSFLGLVTIVQMFFAKVIV